ncbi:hypothetical protein [Plantactinospora endophytica]|uniref:Uncharacterized protein n=1 Tax=Plantactinospora endophytica TaxID=673535 RepID=A0ABQ4E3Q0_9ACTN|nr:hypothetical protein [Plantactinospora endophytica]GIG88936.1 hypothetical protein Pen02_38720 [Plantactinospora endophytica]
MPNHGYEPPAPVLLARHRRSGGAHVGYRRVTGVHRAEGLGRPARRYLFTVALLAGTSSLPILAAIGSGSATVADGMPPADATPFVPPSAGLPPLLVSPHPTVPPVVEPGPAGTGARSQRTGWRPFLVPPGGLPDRAAPADGEPGRLPPVEPPGANDPGLPGAPVPPTAGPPPQSPAPPAPPSPSPETPSPTPSPVASPSPSRDSSTGSPSAAPSGPPAPSGTPTAPSGPPAPTGAAPTPGATASAGPTATPEPTDHPATPAPTPAPVPSTPPV